MAGSELRDGASSAGIKGLGVAIAPVRLVGERFEIAGDVETEALTQRGEREDDLMPAIDRLSGRIGAKPSDLALVAVSVGPGGFTALRVAVTVAKTICLTTGAKCVGVPSSLVIAHGTKGVANPFAVLLAGKGDSSYATVFERWDGGAALKGDIEREIVKGGRLVTAGNLAGLGVRTIVSDRFLPKAIVTEAERLGIVVVRPVFDAEACLRLGLELPWVSPEALSPIYPREPEAVTKWRALHPDQ